MIKIQHHPEQLRIDTFIRIIEQDGTEMTAPVLVLVSLAKLDDKQQNNVIKIANKVLNRDLVVDRRVKATASKKPWYKFW